MPSPLVSVIIPCYRQGRFLASSVRSALQQSYSPIEVIVVNDGSDDDTEQVAHRFGSQVRYIHQANAGVSAARNRAIGLAQGEYLHFLDADDLLHPDAIGWLVDAARGRPNPLCVMGSRKFTDETDLAGGETTLPPRAQRMVPYLLYHGYWPPAVFLSLRTAVLAAGAFDTTLIGCEDWDWSIRVVSAGAEMVPIYRIGAYYRLHANAVTRNKCRMALMAATVLRRSLRLAREPAFAKRIGANPASVYGAMEDRLYTELLQVGYELRQQQRYASAAYHLFSCLREVGWSADALVSLCKLLPHKFMRTIGRLAHRP